MSSNSEARAVRSGESLIVDNVNNHPPSPQIAPSRPPEPSVDDLPTIPEDDTYEGQDNDQLSTLPDNLFAETVHNPASPIANITDSAYPTHSPEPITRTLSSATDSAYPGSAPSTRPDDSHNNTTHVRSDTLRSTITSDSACHSSSSVLAESTTPSSERSLEVSSPFVRILINDEKLFPCDPIAIMSDNYYYPPHEEEEAEQDQFQQNYQPQYNAFSPNPQQTFPAYTVPSQVLPSHHGYPLAVSTAQSGWSGQAPAIQQQLPTPTTATYGYQGYQSPEPSLFPSYTESMASLFPQMPTSGSTGYLSPPLAGPSRPRPHRTSSVASRASSVSYTTDNSRSGSPNAAEMARWGTRNEDGTWRCSHPGCTSQSTFSRGCDLRKHYKRHNKTLFCRYEGCPQATRGGFSDKKDRQRHESRHNPQVECEWEGCPRLFSRVDNMKDHVRRVHLKTIRRGG